MPPFVFISSSRLVYNFGMSGHSKWSKVKRQKEINDPKKSRAFSIISKKIQACSREHGPSLDTNPTLRTLVDEARSINMTNEKIERAINKGAGIGDEGSLTDVRYEGYGPGGVAVLVLASTDNNNRTVSEIRKLFKDSGGSLGEPGSAAFVFGSDAHHPSFATPLSSDNKGNFENLIEQLEENDDVTDVFHNAG